MFRVVWLQVALDELTTLWIQADAALRQAITAASHIVDQRSFERGRIPTGRPSDYLRSSPDGSIPDRGGRPDCYRSACAHFSSSAEVGCGFHGRTFTVYSAGV